MSWVEARYQIFHLHLLFVRQLDLRLSVYMRTVSKCFIYMSHVLTGDCTSHVYGALTYKLPYDCGVVAMIDVWKEEQ